MATHIDYETAGRVDINKLGAYRYANDPSLRILMFAICKDDGPVYLWDHNDPDCVESGQAKAVLKEALFHDDLFYAFNAPFEIAVSRYNMLDQIGVEPPALDRWRCVQAMANRAQLPPSLKALAKALKLDEQKEDVGMELITIFSKMSAVGNVITLVAPEHEKVYGKSERGRKAPNRRSLSPIQGWQEGNGTEIIAGTAVHHDEILWDWFVKVGGKSITVREAYELFKSYCRQDVRVECDVHRKLKAFELRGKILESFQFSLEMNDRGIPVNLPALKHTNALVCQYQVYQAKRFRKLTGLNPSQNIKFGDWLRERGYWEDNLQADTVEEVMEIAEGVLTPDAFKALSIFSMLNFAVLKKLLAMERAACADGRVRGTMQWHGARTGRATGRIIQPQNMKKSTMNTDDAYEMLCDGCSLEDLDELWASPLEAISSCARHFVQVPGKLFNDADYRGVEARIAPWLVDAHEKMASILRGEDQYRVQATKAFGVAYEDVTKAQRTVGKPIELSCQFGTGGRGMQVALCDQYKVALSLKECKRIVSVFREGNPEMCAKDTGAWAQIEGAAKDAILNKKPTTILNGRIKISRGRAAGVPYLIIQLPSGRALHYPHPRIKKVWKKYTQAEMKEEPWKADKGGYSIDEIQFFGRDTKTKQWCFTSTWGSRLFENIVQAIGVDLLDEGCMNAASHGFDIFMIVHDQALCLNEGRAGEIEDYSAALCDVGDWAATFPLEADGNIVPYYLKD